LKGDGIDVDDNADNVTEAFGTAIRTAREETGMTRAELAAKLRITPRHLGAIENNEKKPSFELLFHLIRELDITADRIFYPETDDEHLELEQIILELCQGDDERLNTILLFLHSLVKENRENRKAAR
jgi:transcriptional regulator with XRE-family HTH domain